MTFIICSQLTFLVSSSYWYFDIRGISSFTLFNWSAIFSPFNFAFTWCKIQFVVDQLVCHLKLYYSLHSLLTHITANTSPFEGRSATVSVALPMSESKMKISRSFLIGAFVKVKQISNYFVKLFLHDTWIKTAFAGFQECLIINFLFHCQFHLLLNSFLFVGLFA